MTNRPLILLVFANDPIDPLAKIQQEMQSLQNILQPIAERLHYDIQILETSSVTTLIQQLDDNRDRLILLHFAGHSNSEVLKLDEGVAHASGLVDKLRACKKLQLLFLNGCNNARQVQRFVEVGISATIGTSLPIVDSMACEFSEHFYTGLAEGKQSGLSIPVSFAFKQAKASLKTVYGDQHHSLDIRSLDESVTGATPKWAWFLEQTGQHDWKLEEAAHPCNRLPVLPAKNPDELPSQPFKNLFYYTPDDAEIFFGRCQPALDVLECLSDTRYPLLLLHGGTGVGKSSFLQAGLIPRLRARQQPVTDPVRYDERIVLNNLLSRVFGSEDLTAIHTRLDATGEQPTIWVLDQLEEIFFKPDTQENTDTTPDTISKDEQQDNIPDALNLLLKTLQNLFPPSQPDKWPNARIIFSLRTEWFGELHDACRQYKLDNQDYLLKPLGKTDIIEVIEQPARSVLLVGKYNLHIENPPTGRLAEQIADDLLEDKESNIAPPLQIMLSKLWQRVEHLPPEQRIWTQALYEKQKAQGLLLSEHLDQQLREMGALDNAWGKRAHDSGLLLDVLHAHTTLQGTAKTVSQSEYNRRYAHIPFRDVLAKAFADRYLLVDPLNNKQQLRLAHDSLATVVKARYETSDLPGQRARRVLHSRKADWDLVDDVHKGTALDSYDLKLIELGQDGTRDWRQDDLETAIVHKSRKKRRNGRVVVGSVVATLVLAFVATVFLYLQAEEQRRLTEEQVLETNHSLAKAFEEKTLSSLSQWQETKNATFYREAWLYALEAQSRQLPADQIPVVPTALGQQAQFLSLNTERKTTPAIKLGDIRALAYSPDGKTIASGSADPTTSQFPTAHVWNAETGEALITLEGHTSGITSIAYSPDGQSIATGSYDKTIKLWSTQTGQVLNNLQGHTHPVLSIAYSPDGKVLASGSRDSTIILWDTVTGQLLLTLQGHEGPVGSLAYSRDGTFIVSGSQDSTVRIWDVANGEMVHLLQGHENGVMALAYSPDGEVIASGSQDNTIILWDAKTGTGLKQLKGHAKTVWALAYSPDGQVLASGSNDQAVILWDAQSGEALNTIRHHTSGVTALAYSPDGQVIVSGSFDETIVLWDTQTGKVLAEQQGHTKQITNLAYSPNGEVVASASADELVRLWHANTGETLKALRGHTDDVWGLDYSPDGTVIASGSWDGTVRLWDAETAETLQVLEHDDEISSLSYDPDGSVIAVGSVKGNVYFWSASKGELLKTVEAHTDAITKLVYSPDGKMVATASHDMTINLWDANTGDIIKTLKGHTANIWSLAFSPNSQLLGSGAADNTIRLWDMASGEIARIMTGHVDKVVSLAFSPDGQVLASGSKDDTMRLWSVQTGETLTTQRHDYAASALTYSPDGRMLTSGDGSGKLHFWDVKTNETANILQGHDNPVTSIAYSPNQEVLASGSFDGSVRLWDTQSGKALAVLQHNQVMKLAYSPDGKRVASGSNDGTIKLWSIETGEVLRTLQGESEAIIAVLGYSENTIASLAFSPDGQIIAAGLSDNTIRLWSASNGEALKTLQGHSGGVSALAFSPDAKTLASGSSDKAIRLWDTSTGEVIKTLSAHTREVSALAYSLDGEILASGSNDNTVRLWDMQKGEILSTLQGHSSLVTTLAFSPDGRVLASGSTDSTVRLWGMLSGGTLLNILQGHTKAVMALSYNMGGETLASGSLDNTIRLWNLNSPGHRLLYDFDPNEVSAALRFLWQLEPKGLTFENKPHQLSLLPQMGHHIAFTANTKKYAALLQAPRLAETKMDQLVRFLDDQKAYKKTEQLLSGNSDAYLGDVANRLRQMAIAIYADEQRRGEMEERYKKALTIYRSLSIKDESLYRPYMASILNGLGYILSSQTQRRSEVEALLTEALSIYRQLAREKPEEHSVMLAATLESIGHAHIQWQEFPQAKVYLDEALEIMTPLVEKAPEGTFDWVFNDIKESLNKVTGQLNKQ